MQELAAISVTHSPHFVLYRPQVCIGSLSIMNFNIMDPALFANPDALCGQEGFFSSQNVNSQTPLPNHNRGVVMGSPYPDSPDFPAQAFSTPQYQGYPPLDDVLCEEPSLPVQNHDNELRNSLYSQGPMKPTHSTATLQSASVNETTFPVQKTKDASATASPPSRRAAPRTVGHRKPVNNNPKFYCGEPNCNFFRSNGGTHNSGRYAMSKHYKHAHPELQFDFKKLIETTTGQKSQRMLPLNNGVQNNVTSVPAFGSRIVSAVIPDPVIDPALLALSPSEPATIDYSRNTKVQAMAPLPLQPVQTQALLLLQRPRVIVPDVTLPTHDIPGHVHMVREQCDIQVAKVRRHMLAFYRRRNQSDEQSRPMRKEFFTEWIQKARLEVLDVIGTLPYGAGFGAFNDIVMEVHTLFIFASKWSCVEAYRTMPDGSEVTDEEMARRDLCCELQAMKYTLQFCWMMVEGCVQQHLCE